jgi:hypothetical protein
MKRKKIKLKVRFYYKTEGAGLNMKGPAFFVPGLKALASCPARDFIP